MDSRQRLTKALNIARSGIGLLLSISALVGVAIGIVRLTEWRAGVVFGSLGWVHVSATVGSVVAVSIFFSLTKGACEWLVGGNLSTQEEIERHDRKALWATLFVGIWFIPLLHWLFAMVVPVTYSEVRQTGAVKR
jgi:hypothetical protein